MIELWSVLIKLHRFLKACKRNEIVQFWSCPG